jgi:hypothetical protein
MSVVDIDEGERNALIGAGAAQTLCSGLDLFALPLRNPNRELESMTVWSGRGDLNARPPAPKAVHSTLPKCLVFHCLGLNQLRATY